MILLLFLQLNIWRAYETQVCFFKWNYAFFKFKEIFELEFYNNFYHIIDKTWIIIEKNMNKRILLCVVFFFFEVTKFYKIQIKIYAKIIISYYKWVPTIVFYNNLHRLIYFLSTCKKLIIILYILFIFFYYISFYIAQLFLRNYSFFFIKRIIYKLLEIIVLRDSLCIIKL